MEMHYLHFSDTPTKCALFLPAACSLYIYALIALPLCLCKKKKHTGCFNSREEVLSQFDILHYTCIYSCETVLIICPRVRALLQYILFNDFVILLRPSFNLPL